MYQYMLAAKMVTVVRIPLKEINPAGGPLKTLRGQRSRNVARLIGADAGR